MTRLLNVLRNAAYYTGITFLFSFVAFWAATLFTIFLTITIRFWVLLFLIACCLYAFSEYAPEVRRYLRKLRMPRWADFRKGPVTIEGEMA